MQIKQKKELNHYVPKTYLRGWETKCPRTGKNTFKIFDLVSQKDRLADKDRSFAAIKDLYVILDGDERDEYYEDFFGEAEDVFGKFLDFLRRRDKLKIKTPQWGMVIEAIIALGYRNPKTLNCFTNAIKQALEEDAQDFTDVQIKEFVLSTMLDQIEYHTSFYEEYIPLVLTLPSHDLITCEVPFWNLAQSKFKKDLGLIPLTSNRILMIGDNISILKDIEIKSKNAFAEIDLVSLPENAKNLIRITNDLTLARAREWIAYSTLADAEEVKRVKNSLDTEKIKQRSKLDVFRLSVENKEFVINMDELDKI